MPTFAWEGRTRAGEVRKGVMEAEAEPEIANRLRAQGITMSKAKKKAKDINIKLPFGGGVSEKDIVVWRTYRRDPARCSSSAARRFASVFAVAAVGEAWAVAGGDAVGHRCGVDDARVA